MLPGFTIQSSKVPQTGLITTDLNLQPTDTDQLYKFQNPGGLSLYTFTAGIGWEGDDGMGDTDEPTINVGQAFLYNSTAPGTVIWTRSFNVN